MMRIVLPANEAEALRRFAKMNPEDQAKLVPSLKLPLAIKESMRDAILPVRVDAPEVPMVR